MESKKKRDIEEAVGTQVMEWSLDPEVASPNSGHFAGCTGCGRGDSDIDLSALEGER